MNLFVYGTLLFPEIRECVGGRPFLFETATLRGFEVLKVKGATFPGAVRSHADKTETLIKGEILFDLTSSEMAKFDAYEDRFYRKILIEVENPQGDLIPAHLYEVPESIAEEMLTDEPWTREWFAEHHREDFYRRIQGL